MSIDPTPPGNDPGLPDADDLPTIIAAKPAGASPVAAAVMGANPDAPVPFVFGRRIASGGMGAILEGDDCKLGRKIAVKVMLDPAASAEQTQRFVQEAGVLGKLAHPNIVPVYDLGRDSDGALYYTMKLVKGRTLQDILNELRHEQADTLQNYTLDRLLTIFRKVCDALAFAHAQKIIHRDLKPENIMVGEFGEVLVMDWGISKLLGSSNDEGGMTNDENNPAHVAFETRPLPLNSDTAAQTLDGAVLGTPNYMSPEQAMGQVAEMDARSDIFSLGGILYAILTLRPPVEGKDVWEVIAKVSSADITAPAAFGAATGKDRSKAKGEVLDAKKIKPLPHCPSGRVPLALSAVAMKALRLDKARRYQDVTTFSADIEKHQNGFATSAENAGLGKQLVLLVKRHKGMFGTAAAAWAIITALAVWFVINLRVSERKATHHAEVALANEKEAVAEKENVRHALAKSALALAEAAYREADGPAMQAALDTVPADLRDANWSYLLEQSDTSIARISNIGFRITSVAAHPKQPGVFAVVGEKQQVVLVNARTGEISLRFDFDLGKGPGGPGQGFHLSFSPDGKRIALGKANLNNQPGGIAIHDARDGTRGLAWDSTPVARLEFSPEGRHLLQLSRDGKQHANLWDALNGKLLWRYKLEAGGVLRAGMMPDGQHVLATIQHANPVLLKTADGGIARTLEAKVGYIDAFAISPDGNTAVWGDANGDMHGVDLRDGHLLFSTHAHAASILHAAFTPDGERFISIAALPDGRQSISTSNARTGALMQTLFGGSGGVKAIAIHPLSGELLVGGQLCRAWDVTGTAPRWSMPLPDQGPPIGGAAFCGSDDLFLGPSKGWRTVLHELNDSSTQWKSATAAHRMPSISADGKLIALANAVTSSARIQVARRDGGTYSTLREFDVAGQVRAMRLNPAGDCLAVATKGSRNEPSVLDPATGERLVALNSEFLQTLNDIQWVGEGTQLIGLATANKPRGVDKSEERIIVWDAASGQQLRSVVHPTALDCLVVAPDGKRFAAAGTDKLVHVFDTETLAERHAFRAHDAAITALAWHPSRPIMATASADLTIKLWNLDTGRRLETLRGPTAAPRVLNFSPSGQRLACASEDRMVRIWEPLPLNNALLDAPATDGWEDLLAKLTTDEVEANGNGWTLSGGVLMSSAKNFAAVPLGGSFARSSYQVRATVRSLDPKSFLALILPVADQQVSFLLDGHPSDGFVTGLATVDGRHSLDMAESVRGQQIKNNETHSLEVTVRLSAKTAQITATLDDRPLYEWSGAPTSLTLSKLWPAVPQTTLRLGTSSADWVVSAVKVRRLKK